MCRQETQTWVACLFQAKIQQNMVLIPSLNNVSITGIPFVLLLAQYLYIVISILLYVETMGKINILYLDMVSVKAIPAWLIMPKDIYTD